MSENRTARNEAWMVSLVLHVALLAGVVAVIGRPREAAEGPVVVNTRDTGHTIGVVMLDEPAARPVRVQPPPLPIPEPVVSAPPAVIVQPPPLPVADIRPVVHQEPAAPLPMTQIHPTAGVPVCGSPAGSPPSAPAPAVPPVTDVSGSPLPAGAATAFFGVPAVGKSVVFVLDRSASMGLDGRLDRARRELAASLRRLPPAARFQVIAYNKTAESVRIHGMDGLLPATPDTVEGAITVVNELPAEGGSEHLKALTKALALGPDVVYFLTDEDDLEARDVQTVTRINHGRVSIHALCLVPQPGGESPMRELARANRGLFKVVGW